ncbi:MAG: peptidoglycan -binding protein [Pseudomonadota bacterium]|nr:peptidoglycan -binding protein [Pseudomonadota bacterium]
MALSTRRRRFGSAGMEAWPGYVDALSTLLMVIIFVLLVFVLAQGFLTYALSGRSRELDQVSRKLSEVGKMLALEQTRSTGLEGSVTQLTSELSAANGARQSLSARLATLGEQVSKLTAARAALAQQLSGANQQAQTSGTKATQLAGQLAEAEQRLADMRREEDALNHTVSVNQATLQAKLADMAKLDEQARALAALRDQLELQAQNAAAAAMTEKQRREAVQVQLGAEQKLGDSAKAQIALLNQQTDQLKAQLASLAEALDIAAKTGRDKDVQIANLGQRLNTALAAKVQELQGYRSDFFGSLRRVLAGEPGIQVVGDRFVMQSDVLFPVGSADLSSDGVVQISKLAETVKRIAARIPPNIIWILDVDGYADRQPINGGQYTSNWELSAARAISVVQLLIKEGVPQDHLGATGFGENHPLDDASTKDAYAKNRRIELRLTDYNRTRNS